MSLKTKYRVSGQKYQYYKAAVAAALRRANLTGISQVVEFSQNGGRNWKRFVGVSPDLGKAPSQPEIAAQVDQERPEAQADLFRGIK